MTTIKMEPFTQADWWCYSGCDSANPFIAHLDHGDVIVDGKHVQFFKFTEDQTEDIWLADFASEQQALAVGELLANGAPLEVWLRRM